jgi:hypothetical protein
MKSRDLQGTFSWKKNLMAIFEYVGKFFFQNDVLKLQEDFSEHGITYFWEWT